MRNPKNCEFRYGDNCMGNGLVCRKKYCPHKRAYMFVWDGEGAQ